MTAPTFPALCAIPYYDEPTTYLVNWNRLRPWEFNGWKAESLSWKTGCYIHSGLSDSEVRFKGPEVGRDQRRPLHGGVRARRGT
jgi:hypothetical protein